MSSTPRCECLTGCFDANRCACLRNGSKCELQCHEGVYCANGRVSIPMLSESEFKTYKSPPRPPASEAATSTVVDSGQKKSQKKVPEAFYDLCHGLNFLRESKLPDPKTVPNDVRVHLLPLLNLGNSPDTPVEVPYVWNPDHLVDVFALTPAQQAEVKNLTPGCDPILINLQAPGEFWSHGQVHKRRTCWARFHPPISSYGSNEAQSFNAMVTRLCEITESLPASEAEVESVGEVLFRTLDGVLRTARQQRTFYEGEAAVIDLMVGLDAKSAEVKARADELDVLIPAQTSVTFVAGFIACECKLRYDDNTDCNAIMLEVVRIFRELVRRGIPAPLVFGFSITEYQVRSYVFWGGRDECGLFKAYTLAFFNLRDVGSRIRFMGFMRGLRAYAQVWKRHVLQHITPVKYDVEGLDGWCELLDGFGVESTAKRVLTFEEEEESKDESDGKGREVSLEEALAERLASTNMKRARDSEDEVEDKEEKKGKKKSRRSCKDDEATFGLEGDDDDDDDGDGDGDGFLSSRGYRSLEEKASDARAQGTGAVDGMDEGAEDKDTGASAVDEGAEDKSSSMEISPNTSPSKSASSPPYSNLFSNFTTLQHPSNHHPWVISTETDNGSVVICKLFSSFGRVTTDEQVLAVLEGCTHAPVLIDVALVEHKQRGVFRALIMKPVPGLPGTKLQLESPLALTSFCRLLYEAVEKMHEAGVAHLDIKPAHIFVHQEHVVLLDFGCSFLKSWVGSVDTAHLTSCGTPGYRPKGFMLSETPQTPESFDDIASADVFAAAVSVLEMMDVPIATHGLTDQFADILQEEPAHRARSLDSFLQTKLGGHAMDKRKALLSEEFVDFLATAMHPKPAKRTSAAQALSHPFLHIDG